MVKQIGDKTRVSCLVDGCLGWMDGTYGGKFHQGEENDEWTQHLNCKCDRCGLEKREVFEVFGDRCGYFVTDKISVRNDELDCSFAWEGFGMPVAEMEDPEAMLSTAAERMIQEVAAHQAPNYEDMPF